MSGLESGSIGRDVRCNPPEAGATRSGGCRAVKPRTLIWRRLRFHGRAPPGVVLGAAVGSAALVGALVVGDSVRESLHDMALARLGWVDAALVSNDRFFRTNLEEIHISGNHALATAVMQLQGTASVQDGSARA